ncbi:hypothetical protein F5Y09DRAFT_343985 [Xylaria sp. FL1042]|nr:hypothetical protein F5Y09DRAFT_343985 [Xylaria sp. FL1042]
MSLCEQYEVEFLHRTVKDFLQEHYLSELRALVSTDFNLSRCLVQLTLMLIQQVLDSGVILLARDYTEHPLISQLFHYLRDMQKNEGNQKPPPHFKFVDALDNIMMQLMMTTKGVDSVGRYRTSWVPLIARNITDFTQLTIQQRLRSYSLHLLEMQQKLSPNQAYAYMRVALGSAPLNLTFLQESLDPSLALDPKLVAELLDLGIDPNTRVDPNIRILLSRYEDNTAWSYFLWRCVSYWKEWSIVQRADALDAIRVFLRHGAKEMLVSGVSNFLIY